MSPGVPREAARPRAPGLSLSLKVFKRRVCMWHLGTWLSVELGSVD